MDHHSSSFADANSETWKLREWTGSSRWEGAEYSESRTLEKLTSIGGYTSVTT
jgi:hypothetical protein